MAKFVGFPKCISGWYNTHRGSGAQLYAAELLRQDLDARGVPHTGEIAAGIRHLSESWRDEFRAATRQPLLEQMLRILIRLRGPIRLGLGMIALVLCGALGGAARRRARRSGCGASTPFRPEERHSPPQPDRRSQTQNGQSLRHTAGRFARFFFCAQNKSRRSSKGEQRLQLHVAFLKITERG